MWPESWKNVKRILTVRLDNIGDIIMLGPALRTLRTALPGAHITLLSSPAGSQVVPLLPWVDDHLTLRPLWQDTFHSPDFKNIDDFRLIRTLRRGKYDVAVIFTSFPQSPHCPAYVCYLAGIPIRLGQSKEFSGSVLTHQVRPLPDYLHQVDRNLYLLEQEGFTAAGRHLELAVSPDADRHAGELLSASGIMPGDPFLIVAPGASCASRRYDAGRYARMLPMLARKTGLPVLVVGSEREQELARALAPCMDGRQVVPVFGKTSVADLAALIRRSSLVVANNSASLHIADAFDKPMVILYSGTDIMEQWRPRSAHARVLNVPVACAPCYRFDCSSHMECLEIPPEKAVEEVLALLSCAGRGTSREQRPAAGMTAAMRGMGHEPSGIPR